jgi:hypothetical protein
MTARIRIRLITGGQPKGRLWSKEPEVKYTFIEGIKNSAQDARELMELKRREKTKKQTFKMFNERPFFME